MPRKVREYYEEDRPSLGKRLTTFLTLIAIVAVIISVVVIGQRLNDQSLALVVGLLLAGIPLLAVCILLVVLLVRQRPREPQPQPQQQMMLPPIIMQMPQQPQLPYYGGNGYDREPATRRGWDVIGVDE